jgi:glycine/D-amino acid oxidase-like deaminating enzyme
MKEKYDVIVVGLGVYGLSIAYYLAKKDLNILLVDQFQVGHSNGSSHSSSRITRSIYEKEIYRDLNQLCLK